MSIKLLLFPFVSAEYPLGGHMEEVLRVSGVSSGWLLQTVDGAVEALHVGPNSVVVCCCWPLTLAAQ